MALRCAFLPTRGTQLLSARDYGFVASRSGTCKRTTIAVTNALRATRKKKPVFDPLKFRRVERSGDLDTALLDRLERIYKEGFSGNNDALLPMEPLWTGPLFEGVPVRVAYQGVRGSYCQEAAVRAFQRCDALPCEGGMESAFEALESDAADRAVLPVENSLDGVIERNYDLMLRHPDLRVVGELLLPINHCLLAVKEAGKRRELKRVISHPQALAHCERRLVALGLEVEAVDNAASAARFVAENRIDDTAVIGSKIAGREYGLEVVEEEIQDDSSNTTRFLILSKPSNKNSNSSAFPGSKTTVAFSLKQGTADLFKALSIFAVRDIKVTKIESRPLREKPLRLVKGQDGGSSRCYFEYVFFVDLEAPVLDDQTGSVERALDQLMQISSFVRVVGSYSTLSIVS
uniref:Arogenate dehydratase n=1 Tax=Pinus pinaster TaxID=71647 RepID=A0A1I9WKA8_PINPS|nr:arogenate dehydratase [Pinus pinaster]